MEESRAITKYTEWINKSGIDMEIRQELLNIISEPEEIEERFSEDLSFGTAGLRAEMGGGTSRMNIYTVGAAAAGFALAVKEVGEADMGIVICYDSRNNSKEFAEVTARVMAKEGVKVLLSDELRPVPMLSYAVRHYRASGGVMITASHNPAEYNGFKVYGEDGGQLSPEKAAIVKSHIETLNPIDVLDEVLPLSVYVAEGTVTYIGEEWYQAYSEMIHGLSESDKLPKETKERLRIVYSPLNGAGAEPVRRILNESGFTRVFTVTDQEKPDGNFTTVGVPNPEVRDAYREAFRFANAVVADVIILTDPDSDRLGVAIPDSLGRYQILSGNQIGILLMEYVLSTRSAAGTLKENSFCITSNVSSRIARNICNRYGVKLYETPTGSKYAAELIRDKDENGDENFVFGFEDTHGYMFGSEVRDKDAVAAAVAIAEMAALSKSYGRKLFDQMTAIYNLYGFAAEKNISITRRGAEGKAEIAKVMNHYRMLQGKLGLEYQDLYYQEIRNFQDMLPESDMLLYELHGLDWIALRPSGTEPKLKIYFGFYGDKYAAASRLSRVSKMLLDDITTVFNGY